MRFFAFITQPICHLMMLYKYFFFRSFFFQCRSVGHITGLNKKPTYRYNTVLYCYLATSSIREEVSQFTTAVNSFHPALKYTWKFLGTFLAFLDKATVYALVFTTNLQIHIVTCCIHRRIHH